MNFMRGFGQEEESLSDQNEVASGNGLGEDRKPGVGKAHDPGNGK